MHHHAPNYEVIDHTADLGMVVKGADARDLFTNAAYAMIDLMIEGDVAGMGAKRQITIEGEDYSDLMVRWLSEILYLFDGEQVVVSAVGIDSISPMRLRSTLTVVPLKRGHHEMLREIKAVTYHQISVKRVHDGWEARIIFDI